MTTNEYNESDHNRDAKQRYADKPQSKPTIAPLKPARVRKPGELGGYQVKALKVLRNAGMEGDAFTATIYRDGKAILAVSNSGNGGSNRYGRVVTTKMPAETLDEARAKGIACRDAEEVFRELAVKATGESIEPEDGFVELLLENANIDKHAAKYGYTRESVVEDVISQRDDTPYPMSDEEKYSLRNPGSLFE